MADRAWLHTRGLFVLATPVDVLSRGPKQARVRLRHSLRWNRKNYPAGSERTVPLYALGERPWATVLVSVGRNQYVPQTSPRGRKAVARG